MNKIIGTLLLVGVYFLARDVLRRENLKERPDIRLAKVRTAGATIMLAFLALLHLLTEESFCEYYPSFCNRFPGFCESFPFLCR